MNRKTIATALVLATITAATPSQAGVQVGIRIGTDRGGYYDRGRYDIQRIAFDNGYRNGSREGEKDDRRDDPYNYRDEKRYREAAAGYRREYGSRFTYATAYRQGFEDGYRRAYSNRRGFDRRRY